MSIMGNRMLTVDRLNHGGIMANYRCTAACLHCLYACSPTRTDGYITQETAKSVCELLRAGGCRSVHIGGGEPFIDFDGLLTLVQTATESGVTVEYIETNAYWAADKPQVVPRLNELLRAGADTLCISLDPFHAEYVPFDLPLSLAKTCQAAGFRYFLWQDKYLPALSKLTPGKAYSRTELELLISPQYILETARGYGLHLGGRAIGIEAEYTALKPAESVMDAKPCGGLLSGGHFHVDLYGRFIPPGCTGITIPLEVAIQGIPEGKYPAFEALLNGGSAELLRYARALGFAEDPAGYPSGCALCFHVRRWLSEHAPSPELDAEHYDESMKYW